jgi:hypothetical protein
MIRIARRLRVDQTGAETVLWNRIRNRQIDGHKFVRQEPIGDYVCGFAWGALAFLASFRCFLPFAGVTLFNGLCSATRVR